MYADINDIKYFDVIPANSKLSWLPESYKETGLITLQKTVDQINELKM